MATTTEIQPGPTIVPPMNGTEPPKRPRGRPRKVVNPDGDDDGPSEIEAAEVQNSGQEDFWSELASIQDWTNRFAYLFRLGPTVDRRSGGRQINIEKFARPFDVDDIMRKHGSGVYRLDLFKINEASGRYTRYRQERFDIVNMDYPPNVPPGDWVNEPENAVWQWAIPKLQAQQQSGAGPNLSAISDMMDKADERAMKMVQIMTPKENGSLETVLGQMVQMNSPERLIALIQAIAPKQDNSMALVVELLRADLKESKEEMKLMRERMFNTPPAKNIVEQFIELKPAIAELVPLFGGRSTKPDIWASIAEKGVEQIPDLIALGRDMMAKKPEAQQQLAAPSAQPRPEPQPSQPLTDEQQARAHLEEVLKLHQQHIFAIVPTIIEYFKVGSGFGLRDWYLPLHGLLNWSELRRQIGPELFRNILLAQPALVKELGPPEMLLQFMREFFTDPDEEADDVEHSQTPPAATPDEAKP